VNNTKTPDIMYINTCRFLTSFHSAHRSGRRTVCSFSDVWFVIANHWFGSFELNRESNWNDNNTTKDDQKNRLSMPSKYVVLW